VPIFRLTRDVVFPDPSLAEADGLLAVGGDLSTERLIAAHACGIFPWYSHGEPILWWSPDPRFVLLPSRLRTGRTMRRLVRRGRFEVTADADFDGVIRRCAAKKRPGQRGTWITPAMRRAYLSLHQLGVAHSIEAREDGRLVGGLYGVSLGGAFFGESMFADVPDASKVAFVRLCESLVAWNFELVDCQVATAHLDRFGAESMPRDEYLERLSTALEKPTRQGRWTLEPAAIGAAAGD
jgi:leucyl/phenylalanyl-tRNA--protein transferase